MSLIDYEVITLGCYGTLIDKVSGVYGALRPMLDKAATRLHRDDVWAAFGRHELALEAEAPGMPYVDILTEVHRRLAKEWYVIASEDGHRLAASKGLAMAYIDRQRETIGRDATLAPIDAACCDFRFASMANLVMAHQDHLRADSHNLCTPRRTYGCQQILSWIG